MTFVVAFEVRPAVMSATLDEGHFFATILADIAENSPDVPAAAEALHFLGIFEFLAGKRDLPKLRARWNAVRERYPQSRFARHSEVIDDAPA